MSQIAARSNAVALASRNSPNHSSRPLSSGKKRKTKLTTHELQVLLPKEEEDEENYAISDVMVCARILLELNNEMTEEEIRRKIVLSSQKELPFLKETDFEFVKRDKNRIYAPTVIEGFQYDYSKVKRLAGQGKIYIRLYDRPMPAVMRNFSQVSFVLPSREFP